MKTIITIFAITLCISFNLKSELKTSLFPITNEATSFAYATYCINNSNLYIIGFSTKYEDIYAVYDFFVNKFEYTDNDIQLIWQKQYDESLEVHILESSSVLPNNSGGFDFWVSTSSKGYNQKPKFFSFDSELSLIQENFDSLSKYSSKFMMPVIPTILDENKNLYLVYFDNYNQSENFNKLMVTKYDSLANYLSEKKVFDFSQEELPSISNLKSIKDFRRFKTIRDVENNTYVLGVLTNIQEDESGNDIELSQSILIKFDKDFHAVWCKLLSDYTEDGNIVYSDIVYRDNLYIVGEFPLLNNENMRREWRLLEVDTQHGNLNKISSSFSNDISSIDISDLLISADNQFILSGNYSIYNEESKTYTSKYYITKLDTNFEQVWELTDKKENMVNTSVGLVVELGKEHYFGSASTSESDYHIDFLGIEIIDDGVSSVKVKDDSSISIEQIDDKLIIDCTSINSNSTKVVLSNIRGQILYSNSMSPNSNSMIIDLNKFTAGVYIVNISGSGKSFSKKIIIAGK